MAQRPPQELNTQRVPFKSPCSGLEAPRKGGDSSLRLCPVTVFTRLGLPPCLQNAEHRVVRHLRREEGTEGWTEP